MRGYAVPVEVRREIARLVNEEGWTCAEAGRRFGLSHPSAVRFARRAREGLSLEPAARGPRPGRKGRADAARHFSSEGKDCKQCAGLTHRRPEDGSPCRCGERWAPDTPIERRSVLGSSAAIALGRG